MRQIGTGLPKPGSQVSRRESGPALRRLAPNDPLPRIYNRSTDVDIPGSAWSSWTEEGKARQLRRALTAAERLAIEARRDELAPALMAYDGDHETDVVRMAILDMFAGYRSMRQTGDDSLAVVESTRRALRAFPAWAIENVCSSIQTNGVWRDGKFDRQWPPNDSEIVDAVRKEVAHYQLTHKRMVDLLAATVEEGE